MCGTYPPLLGDFHQNGPNPWFYESSFLKKKNFIIIIEKGSPYSVLGVLNFFSSNSIKI